MKSIEDFVKQLKISERDAKRVEREKRRAKKKKKDYYSLRNKHKYMKSERRRVAEKLSLWRDIKKWRNKIIKIPKVQKFINDHNGVNLSHYTGREDNVYSISLTHDGKITFVFDYKFGGLDYVVLNNNNIRRVPLKFLRKINNSIEDGSVYKEMLDRFG